MAPFSVKDSNGFDVIKVSEMDKNPVPQDGARSHRTLPGPTGCWQVPQDAARSHSQVTSDLVSADLVTSVSGTRYLLHNRNGTQMEHARNASGTQIPQMERKRNANAT